MPRKKPIPYRYPDLEADSPFMFFLIADFFDSWYDRMPLVDLKFGGDSE